MNNQLTVSSSPHIRNYDTTRTIMSDVIIALLPALLMAVYFFGPRALMLVVVSVISCVAFEALYQKLLHKPCTIGDMSAVLTGILLAFNLPVAATWWMTVVGSFFAIVIVKQLFGGLGKNFVNPALAARAFLFSWVTIMTTWTNPFTDLPIFGSVDVVSSATPLMLIKQGIDPNIPIWDLFLGFRGGCIGEVSAIALLLGAAYLLIRKVISIRIPLCYIGTVAILTFLFPRMGTSLTSMTIEILSGGLLIGAFFMATDYTTSPVTKKGQIIFGIGCGLLTVLIRYFGGYPEGVSYSILIMNICVWMIDKYTSPRKFGEVAKAK